MSLPFALDIDLSPVTSIELCSNCPDDFVAKLQSFQTKIVDYSYSTRVCVHWWEILVYFGSEDRVILNFAAYL